MKHLMVVVVLLFAASAAPGQEILTGVVLERTQEGTEEVLAGASVYWQGTTRGTVTDPTGKFTLASTGESFTLIIRHAGHRPDTLALSGQRSVRVVLQPDPQEVEEVRVVGKRQGTVIDYMNPQSVQRMTEKELTKAACCNLSESFETNPSIDVSFTDAITGTRQIEMLGLSGVYTQTTLENMPYIRGLTSNVGLTFIPGPWIKAINVSKGIGSVANGYESITGQIDVNLRSPEAEDEKRLFLNLYGNQDQRFEGNLHFRQALDERWSSMTLLHASAQRNESDQNGDLFMDMPVFRTLNATQRFHFTSPEGWEGQFNAQFVSEDREGGTRHPAGIPGQPGSVFRYGTDMRFLRVSGKTGHVFPGLGQRSIGLQWSLGKYTNRSSFGPRDYSGEEQTGYINLLYQQTLGSPANTIRAGLSFLFDQFEERFVQEDYARVERVPGAFVEYTWSPAEELTVVGGFRVDRHNAYGTMLTPRLHLRYAPDEDWVLRLAAGRGYRTGSIFTENATVFASSRAVAIDRTTAFAYGLGQEIAWNYGGNLTHYFLIGYREATISFDAYRTLFERQTAADLDSHPREVYFRTLAGGSYATSLQVELNVQPLERFETRLAYRYLDVRQKLEGIWRQRPLSARHRALVNLAYATAVEEEGDARTAFDLTVQWFGPKRLPGTLTNPEGVRARSESPGFATLNAQVSRQLMPGLELYVGGENLLDFRQEDPILDAANPSSPYFDASLVWGPVTGRTVYAGLRFGL